LCGGREALAIVTEWDEFRALDLPRIKSLLASPNLIDLRNIYRPATSAARFQLFEHRPGLKQARGTGQGVLRRRTTISGFGGQDHELPDRVFACYADRAVMPLSTVNCICPKAGTDDPMRMAKAHVPQQMIDNASAALRPSRRWREP